MDLEDLHIVVINADWRMLTYADVCWSMLAYAGVCWQVKELVDFEDLHIVVINQVLDHIEKNTHVPGASALSLN